MVLKKIASVREISAHSNKAMEKAVLTRVLWLQIQYILEMTIIEKMMALHSTLDV